MSGQDVGPFPGELFPPPGFPEPYTYIASCELRERQTPNGKVERLAIH
jgi:hypothetical protein